MVLGRIKTGNREGNGGVPARWLTGGGGGASGGRGGSQEPLGEGWSPRRPDTVAREGDRRRGGFGAQGRRWRGWRASREHGEAARGVGVDREEVGRTVHDGLEQRQGSSTAVSVLCPGKEEGSE
jgi:hypothetical protein